MFSNVGPIVFVIMIVQSEFHIHDDLYIYTRRTCPIGLLFHQVTFLFNHKLMPSFVLQIKHFFTHKL